MNKINIMMIITSVGFGVACIPPINFHYFFPIGMSVFIIGSGIMIKLMRDTNNQILEPYKTEE